MFVLCCILCLANAACLVQLGRSESPPHIDHRHKCQASRARVLSQVAYFADQQHPMAFAYTSTYTTSSAKGYIALTHFYIELSDYHKACAKQIISTSKRKAPRKHLHTSKHASQPAKYPSHTFRPRASTTSKSTTRFICCSSSYLRLPRSPAQQLSPPNIAISLSQCLPSEKAQVAHQLVEGGRAQARRRQPEGDSQELPVSHD